MHLAALLEASTQRFPDRPAVVGPDGRTLSYRELSLLADRVHGFLCSQGIGSGDRVGLVLPKSCEAVAILFGILKAGACYVPVDYTAPFERNRAILNDCAARVVFCTAQFASAELAAGAGTPGQTLVVLPPPADPAPAGPGLHPWESVLSVANLSDKPTPLAGLAFILYTSGSTGVPKGVKIGHDNALAFIDWCSSVFNPTATDQFASHAPFHFDLSVHDLFVSVKHGATVHLVDESTGKNPRLLGQFIEARKITIWYSAPSILSMMGRYGRLERSNAKSLRLVLFAGEVFQIPDFQRLVSHWPHPHYYNLYGPTETNVCTAALTTPADLTHATMPIGPACPHCDTMLIDEQENTITDAQEGQLCVAGPSVFHGYWNRPELDADCFIERESRRWYKTGDLVRPEPGVGYLFLGRRDRMVKRRGYRVELGEIESVLSRNEQIREVAALSRATTDGTEIVAYISLVATVNLSVIDLRVYSMRVLPAYMVPDSISIVSELPRTSTGKIDYQKLARLAISTRT